jgi:hypothetical protein
MSLKFTPSFLFSVQETLESGVDAAPAPTISHTGFNVSGIHLTGTTTPAAAKFSARTHALSAGSLTLDLTALPGTADAVVNANGLKLQALLVANREGNATLNIAGGDANPYPLFGAGNDVDVPAGGRLAFYFPEGLPDVSGTAKTVKFTGSGTQSFDLLVVFG